MKNSALKILHESFFPLILLTIAVILCIQNYTPGTFLSGWDTLHPEFNFKLNIARTLFGVFRTEQGLGAVAAHAHMVELPRIFILYLLHFAFPLSALRYLYIFLCLIAGPLGMYIFLYRILIKKRLPSFVGALFYLLNLGTYQTFVVPFEMFTTLYATLPFVYWLVAEYLKAPKKRFLALYSLAIILTAPAAYASTLWFIFFLSLLLFFIPYVYLSRKQTKNIVRNFFILIILTLLLNLYWLLPNIYFAISQGQQIASANINKLFSEEAFLKNKEFGHIKDILLLKSFYFDWGIYNYKTSGFQQLTQIFQTYIAAPSVSLIGYFFASLILIGIIFAIKTARKYISSFLFLTLFCLLFLVNANQPFSAFFLFFQNHVPLFKEAFRFPDDKILNIFIFLVSIFFAYSMLLLFSLFKKFKLLTNSILLFSICSLLFLYMLPAFTGNLIHPSMKVKIPLEYFSLFDALKNEKGGRIANLPVNSPWGWVYHNWYGTNSPSFQGAGFLYFGITPSILERDFDRWNPLNEQYYREMSHAVYASDSDELSGVIKKYNITHILIDTSIINPGSDNKSLYYYELFQLLNKLQNERVLTDKRTFGKFITLYRVRSQDVVSTMPQISFINRINASYYKDTIYEQFGDYISNPKSQLTFPFVGIFDNESKALPTLIKTTDTNISLQLPANAYSLNNNPATQPIIPTSIIATLTKKQDQNILNVSLYPQTPLFDNSPLLAPIKGNFEYAKSINPLLSVNKQVFSIKELQEKSPTALGTIFLNSTTNNIALFDDGNNITRYSIADIPLSFTYCKEENNSLLNIIVHPDQISFRNPQKEAVCIKIPLSFIKTPLENSSTLLTISFASNETVPLSTCLTNPLNGSCSEYLSIRKNNGINTITFALNKNDLSTTQLHLSIARGTQEQTLSRLTITSQQAVSESLLTSSFFKVITPRQFKTFTLPKIIDGNYFTKTSDSTVFVNDCKNEKNNAHKELIKDGFFYRYKASSGSYCDHFSFPNLPHSLAYFVYVKSRNIEGLPMNLCITNYTSRRCDLYSKLSRFKSPKEDIFVLPPSDMKGSGYDVNLENTGVIGSPAINDFYSITFVPFSSQLLSEIKTGESASQKYTGVITSKTIYNPLLITTKVNSSALITLSYAYNPGFHAYQVSCENNVLCPFSLILSPLLKTELKHIEISSWENGWITPNAGTVVIIFIPQYLEYIGMLLFMITITLMLSYPFTKYFPEQKFNDFFEKQSKNLKHKTENLLRNK